MFILWQNEWLIKVFCFFVYLLFVLCKNVDIFWNTFFKLWSVLTEVYVLNTENVEECIFFGFPETDYVIHELNYYISLAKYYVYYSRFSADNKVCNIPWFCQFSFASCRINNTSTCLSVVSYCMITCSHTFINKGVSF